MSKKLMMNNVNDDVIVLCKDFSPNGEPFVFWENQMIDWDKYELYINVDVASTSSWNQVIIISADNNVGLYIGNKMHIYSNNTPTIRVQYGNNPGWVDTKVDSMTNVEVIFNKEGFFVDGEKSGYGPDNVYSGWLSVMLGESFTIGNKNTNNLSYGFYNLVQLQPYQERGE